MPRPPKPRVRSKALEVRAQNAAEDWEAAKVLHDPRGVAMPSGVSVTMRRRRPRRPGTAAEDLGRAREQRLAAAEGDLALRLRRPGRAHDAASACQERVDRRRRPGLHCAARPRRARLAAQKDDIIVGRARPEACGFSINLAVFGGHLPGDPAVLHAHFVHDVGYWRSARSRSRPAWSR